jgi:phosphatidylserine decarboxylase
LKQLLVKVTQSQAEKFNAPESAKEIPVFIKFHDLSVDEILEPLDSFKTFNEFFFRKLKSIARPIDQPNDPVFFSIFLIL